MDVAVFMSEEKGTGMEVVTKRTIKAKGVPEALVLHGSTNYYSSSRVAI